jgi:anti-sigma factor RsiW
MLQNDPTRIDSCPSIDISAYIDGELAPSREMELDLHFAGCKVCVADLNQQKEFLCILSSTLQDEGDLELPKNFTRVVVTNAETRVIGLRRRNEWQNAAFICCALFFFVLFGLGADAGKAFGSFVSVFEQLAAVAGFVSHVVYDISLGTVVIIRSLGSFAASKSFVLIGLIATLFLTLGLFSRLLQRPFRA